MKFAYANRRKSNFHIKTIDSSDTKIFQLKNNSINFSLVYFEFYENVILFHSFLSCVFYFFPMFQGNLGLSCFLQTSKNNSYFQKSAVTVVPEKKLHRTLDFSKGYQAILSSPAYPTLIARKTFWRGVFFALY